MWLSSIDSTLLRHSDTKTDTVWKSGKVLTTPVETSTSIETHTSNIEITVAPNPFSTTTKISGLTNGTLKIVTLSGVQVYSQVIQENTVEIDRGGLSSGIYFLQVITNSGVVTTKKVVVQ